MKAHKIERNLTYPNHPQQKGVEKNKNMHLIKIFRRMIHDKNILGKFYEEAMKKVTYVINRMPRQGLSYVSLIEKTLKHQTKCNLTSYVSMLLLHIYSNPYTLKFGEESSMLHLYIL